jgi:hypothetical protein
MTVWAAIFLTTRHSAAVSYRFLLGGEIQYSRFNRANVAIKRGFSAMNCAWVARLPKTVLTMPRVINILYAQSFYGIVNRYLPR